ncbi:MAG: GNAT family N-acetyltransferase [Anaerolineae bacterium]|nr:GNAT family N-acetyltransferase [Anaerolineae bacterium]
MVNTSIDYELVPFTYNSPLLVDAVKVYTHVWSQRTYGESIDFFKNNARRQNFYGYVVRAGKQTIGMGFGTRSMIGQWWHDKVAQKVGEDHPALQDAWVLVELAILPNYRNRGLGLRIHDALLADQPYPNVLLSTQVDNTGARRFYERHGWDYLHAGFAFFENHPLFCIMHKHFPEKV